MGTLRNAVKATQSPRNGHNNPSTGAVVFQTPVGDGICIESILGSGTRCGSAMLFDFVICRTGENRHEITVRLPDYIVELIKAHTGQECIPCGNRFWQAFCEEAVVRRLLKQADIPDDTMSITELTDEMERWASTTLRALAEYQHAKR